MADLPPGYIYCIQCHAHRQFEEGRCVECDAFPAETRMLQKPPGVARAERLGVADRPALPALPPKAAPEAPTPTVMPRLSSPDRNLADVCGALEQEKKELLVENAELRRKLEKQKK